MQPASPNLDALLAQIGWVRDLAHHLVDDPASVDDVEQDGQADLRRRQAAEESITTRGFDPAANSSESFAQRMDTFRHLALLVSQVPDPYGTTIFLHYFEEMSVCEVAKHRGIGLSTAQSHITYGLGLLRDGLEGALGSDWRQCCLIFTLPR